MKKTFTRATPLPAPQFASAQLLHGSLLSLSLLLTTACGDDFSAQDTAATTNDESSSAPTSDGTPASPPVNPPAATIDNEAPGPPNGETSDGSLDASDGPKPPPMDGPTSNEMPGRDCGGEGQICCDREACKPELTCAPSSDSDAGAETSLICQHDDDGPRDPSGDAAPPGPPGPPAPDNDAAPPGPPAPPGPDTDAALPEPPGPPGQPETDAAPPEPPGPPEQNGDCGAEGEQCCQGPGGRCDEGLSCDNPGGPDLDDSQCVAAP